MAAVVSVTRLRGACLSKRLWPTVTPNSSELLERLVTWRKTPDVVTAAELLETAIVYDRESEALSAARYLVRNASAAMPLVGQKASRILVRAGEDVPDSVASTSEFARSVDWRQRIREYPRDALAWVELARMQTISQVHHNRRRNKRTAADIYGHRPPTSSYKSVCCCGQLPGSIFIWATRTGPTI